ncbi:MAG: DNA primase [Candidatus Omnitrophica bacterium]|nr:DNA primase [Candidatus Omnitrophota bacterium]
MGLISEDVIRHVLERSDIAQVLSSYMPLRPAGRNFKALCPFHHEKTPSFVVNPEKQIFHCFGCGAGGNAISFVMQQEHLTFPEAVRLLADRVGIVIAEEKNASPASSLRQDIRRVNELAAEHFHKNLLFDKSESTQKAREYLKARGVTLEIVKKFHLGFSLDAWDTLVQSLRSAGISLGLMEKAGLILPKKSGQGFYDRFRNRVMFPIFDVKNHCVAFGGRAIAKDETAKYINSPETALYTKGEHLYGLTLAKDAIFQKDSVIVVEGYMDFLMPFQSGAENIVASLGTALTTEQIRLLRRYSKNVVMLFDGDPAGEAAMLRSLDLLVEEGMHIRVARLDQGEDPDSFIRKEGLEKFQDHIEKAVDLFDFKFSCLKKEFKDQSIEAKAQIAEQMLVTIGKLTNAIIKSDYLKRLGQNLKVSENDLMAELKRVASAPGARRFQEPVKEDKRVEALLRPVERDLLKVLLEDNSLVASTRQEADLMDFQNEEVRQVIQKIYELFDAGQEVNVPTLMNFFENRNILKIISSLMVSSEAISGDRQKIHQDCLLRLRTERTKAHRRKILSEMEGAQQRGDQQRLQELMQEFNQLMKG